MLNELDNYDCDEAFKYAQSADPVPPGTDISAAGFTREDVKRILFLDLGENDGPDFVGVFELADGRYASLIASRDYTGWDCRAGGNADVAKTEADILRYGVDEANRARLGIVLPDLGAGHAG